MKCKKILTIILSLGLVLSILPVNTAKGTVSKAAGKESNYIVMAGNKEDLDEVREICHDEFQAEEVKTISSLREDYSDNYTVCKLSKTEAEELAIKDNVIVEKDDIISACTSAGDEGTDSDTEWNIKMVRAEEETKPESGNKKIKVAVLDSGVDDFNDVELAGSIDLIPGEEEVLPLFWDVTGHGSSVAGIIAAEKNDVGITGIAPETEIYAAKILDDKNQAPVSRVIDGIYWAIDKNVNIINMSFGLKNNSAALHKAIIDAYNAGILLVAAAGNGDDVEYPAAYDEVIAVGSVDTSGTVSEKSASGDELELAAPGEQICSTGAFEGTLISAGTSMAAPHVTGIAARLWAKDTSVSAEFIRQLMAASANECGEKDSYGYGLVDLAYAEEIYDTFKENYVSKNDLLDNIAENDAQIEKYDDVEYVEGRWTKDWHEIMISNSSLSQSQISVIKSGAIYPDISLAKKSLHPYWHGSTGCKNYITSYIYATKMALALKNNKKPTSVTPPSNLGQSAKEKMPEQIEDINWSSFSFTPSNTNKCLFVWGMAIHNATDVYAHSVEARINGVWEHLDHDIEDGKYHNGLADRRDEFPARYETASLVAKKSLATYVNGNKGNVSDFAPTNGYRNAGIDWLVQNLYENASYHDSTIANRLKAYSYTKK